MVSAFLLSAVMESVIVVVTQNWSDNKCECDEKTLSLGLNQTKKGLRNNPKKKKKL